MKKILCLLVLSLASASLRAQTVDTDLAFAISQLQSSGPGPFAKALYGIDEEGVRQLAERMAVCAKDAGAALSYEMLSRRFIAQKVERIYLVIYFEKRPVFLRVDSYASPKGRLFLSAIVSREAVDVIPLEAVNPAGH